MKKLFFILLLPVCAKAQLASLIVRNDTLFSFNPSTNEWRQLTKTVPPQSGQSGKVISTNGSTYQWSSVNDLIGYTPVSVTRLNDTASAIRASIPSVSGKLNISDTAGMLSGYSRTTHTHSGIYQPADADLTTYAGITPSANVQSLLGAANYSAMRTLLSLVPGTDVLGPTGNGSGLTGITGSQISGNISGNAGGLSANIAQSQVTNLVNDMAAKAPLLSPSFTTPVIGVATGAGGTVTQATSKSTGVTLNKITGEITLNGAALAAGTIVSFTLTNSTVAATDVMILNHVTTGTRGAYTLNAQCSAGSAVIYVRNNTAGSLSEAIVIRFSVVKGVTN